MKKTATSIVILMIMTILLFTGCSIKGSNTPVSGPGSGAEKTVFDINMYYLNDEYLAYGDENLEKYAVVTIGIEVSSSSEIENAMLRALNALKTVPAGAQGISTAIGSKFNFDSVTIKSGTAMVDLKNIKEIRGGDLEESLAIGQIVNTLITSFDMIDRVQILADGQKAETLMGQIDISEPISLDDL